MRKYNLMFVLLFAAVVSGRECEDTLELEECYELLSANATYLCNEHFCDKCEFAGSCDTYCGLCDDSQLVQDCDGNYAPSAWVGDGKCDSGNYKYNSELINFNCPDFDCDHADCEIQQGLWCETPPPTSVLADVTIADIQFQNDTATDVVFYDYDCYKSPLEGATVRVRGVVTGPTLTGIVVQDASMVWSGIYVYTGIASTVRDFASEGAEVEVRGTVSEYLGETRLYVEDSDVTLIALSTLRAIEPLLVTTAMLGGWGVRPDLGCWASAEPYEGVLVTLNDVTVVGVSDVDQRIDIVDASGKLSALSTTNYYEFDVVGYLRNALSCVDCPLENVKIGTLTGVVSYVGRCLYYSAWSEVCIEKNQGLTFSSVVLARSPADIQWPDDEDDVPTPVPVGNDDNQVVYHVSDLRLPTSAGGGLDCPSPLVGMVVEVEAVVTAVDDVGFFMQDRPLPWSGVYVLFMDNYANVSPVFGRAPGDAVRVRGLVVVQFGVLTIEAYDVTVLGRNRKVEPLSISADLGHYVASQGCGIVAEQFESMLVIVKDVYLGPTYDDARCYDCFDAMPVRYGTASSALVDDYLYPDLKLDIANDLESSTLELATLTAVVRYAYECEHRSNPVYCTTGQADFYFAYVLSPRTGDDLQAGDHKSEKESISAKARRTMMGIVVVFALFLGLLVAMLYIYRRRFDKPRVMTQRCEREIEIPMAHATQIVEAPCAPTYVSPVSRQLRLTAHSSSSFWEVVVPTRLEHLQPHVASVSAPDERHTPHVPNEQPSEDPAENFDCTPTQSINSVVHDDDARRATA